MASSEDGADPLSVVEIWTDGGCRPNPGPGGWGVLNMDLWRRVLDAAAPHAIDWIWVRGHSGDPANDRVDRLPTAARAALVT